MIVFNKVRWKNFLSYGNYDTEVVLSKSKTTLVVGKNGSGKSTMLDALSYCLYNKAFRNVNKPQLCNTITQKQLLVEVEFVVGGREYLIRRGQKPNVFEIHQDGSLLNQVADTRDYQGMLEQNILKMNYRSFRQIVVLGSADFMPFMQLPAQARREVIEDLLDIQIFSIMNTLLKSRVAKNKEDLSEIEYKIDLQKNIIAMEEKHLEELKQNNEELIADNQRKIDAYTRENEKSFDLIKTLEQEIQDHRSALFNGVDDKQAEAITIRKKIETIIRKYEKQIVFYKENTTCPTCEQDITEDFTKNRIDALLTKKEDKQAGLADLDTTLSKIEAKIQSNKIILEDIQKNSSKITELNVKINSNNKFIQSIQKSITALQETSKKMGTDREIGLAAKHSLITYSETRIDLLSERETLAIAATLLKDGGIKSRVIKQYVPIMNKLINHYLQMMEFYINFQLDENFKESILSRGRDDFSYSSFSQGEKMRIDLAILFAWRSIAKMRNSASTNLLIFDEIFDSSLDAQGTDEFIKIINTLTADTNTFIISHKIDLLADKFDKQIRFEKVKNFSRIAA